MSVKLVITKPGYDALTETSPNKMIYSSDYDTLKYHVSGSVTVSAPSDGTYVTEYTHGLGYTPFFIAYVDQFGPGAGLYSMCPGHFASFTPPFGVHYVQASAYADATKIYFQVITFDSLTGSFNFRFKIFRNRLGI